MYALKVDEVWEKVALDPSEHKGEYYWQVTARSPWNYALPFEAFKKPEDYFTVSVDDSKLSGNWYWSAETAPVTITAQAGIVKEWQHYSSCYRISIDYQINHIFVF